MKIKRNGNRKNYERGKIIKKDNVIKHILRNMFKVRGEHLVCGKRNRRRKQLLHVIETVIVFLAVY